MFRKSTTTKIYDIFKVWIYITFFCCLLVKGYKNIGSIEIIFLLTYIINNQLRFFILPEENTSHSAVTNICKYC